MQVRGLAALRSVEKHVHRCAALVDSRDSPTSSSHETASCQEPVTPTAELVSLQDAVHALDRALKDATIEPLVGESAAKLGAAFEATQHAWATWCESQQTLNERSASDDMQVQWDIATLRARAAREGLNQILAMYNEAITQFPARLLVNVMGFKPASLM